ncbi:hypothetical protein CEV32_0591 [Brucella rhizosphaerae]|uniref:Uncharacterized protein n=1 Tax=Brucella rhizosphaerae TaxID=571254 RepID=A0A256FIA8_9HYPH|nr:hypothetical protein CEV32_0591 [Brucella rhizosphaerae]
MMSPRISSVICRQMATPLFRSIRFVFAMLCHRPVIGRVYE